MDGPSHYREAEKLTVLAERALASNGFGTHVALIAQAQVHATLALAAAQVEDMESAELRPGWAEIMDGDVDQVLELRAAVRDLVNGAAPGDDDGDVLIGAASFHAVRRLIEGSS